MPVDHAGMASGLLCGQGGQALTGIQRSSLSVDRLPEPAFAPPCMQATDPELRLAHSAEHIKKVGARVGRMRERGQTVQGVREAWNGRWGRWLGMGSKVVCMAGFESLGFLGVTVLVSSRPYNHAAARPLPAGRRHVRGAVQAR